MVQERQGAQHRGDQVIRTDRCMSTAAMNAPFLGIGQACPLKQATHRTSLVPQYLSQAAEGVGGKGSMQPGRPGDVMMEPLQDVDTLHASFPVILAALTCALFCAPPPPRMPCVHPVRQGSTAPWQTSVRQVPTLLRPQCMLLRDWGNPSKTSGQMPQWQQNLSAH
jgi:hypothetical protein